MKAEVLARENTASIEMTGAIRSNEEERSGSQAPTTRPAGTRDGRVVLAAALVAYYAVLLVGMSRSGWLRAWETLGVWPMKPVFGDLAVVLAGLECSRAGFAVRRMNPCDHLDREMNYPGIWMLPAPTGLGMEHLIPIGVGIALLFYASLFLLLRSLELTAGEGLLLGLLLISPSLQLGIERANNDLVIFAVLVGAVLAFAASRPSSNSLALLLVAFAGVLKLYPIAALGAAVLRRDAVRLAALVGAGIVAFTLLNLDGLRQISEATPRARGFSYGANVIPAYLDAKLAIHAPALAPILPAVHIARYVLPLLILLAALFIAVRSGARATLRPGIAAPAFLVGASIYLFTFVLGNNWDYRLVFLLLVVPQTFLWIREGTGLKRSATLLLAAITATLWISPFHGPLANLDELFTWAVFSMLAYLVSVTALTCFPAAERSSTAIESAKAP